MLDIEYLGNHLHKSGFKRWFLFFFKQVEKQAFIIEPIHEDLFQCFQDIYDGKVNRQVINVPPRSGKTTLAIYFVAYALATNMKCNFIYTSFSQVLLADNSRRLSTILNDPLYKAMYCENPEEMDIDSSVVDEFWKDYYKISDDKLLKFSSKRISTSQGGTILFSSIGSTITGYGVALKNSADFSGCLIIDDPNKPIEVHSKTIREKVKVYFEETLLSRLNNPYAPIVNIQQRLHLEDLSGFLKDKYNYSVLKKPLVENDICNLPKQYPPERIEELQKNNYFFSSQYQQEPVKLGGNLIKTEWLRHYSEPKERYNQIYIVCDTAFSAKKSADNSAFMLCGITFENDLHILDMLVGQWDFINLKKMLKEFYQKAVCRFSRFTSISAIYIENKASGQSLIQELRQQRLPIKELYPSYYNAELKKEQVADKYTRFLEISTDIEAGYVYVPEKSDWILDFLAECESFDGLGTNRDDRVDCLIYALKIRRQNLNIDWEKSFNEFSMYNSLYKY